MAYFLRITNTPKEDLERGTSCHFTPYDKSDDAWLTEKEKKRIVEANEGEEIILSEEYDRYIIILPGLCGIEVADIYCMQDEIQELESLGYDGDMYLFEGECVGDCPEGDLFKSERIINKII